MNPSRAFPIVVEEEDEAIALESILRFAELVSLIFKKE